MSIRTSTDNSFLAIAIDPINLPDTQEKSSDLMIEILPQEEWCKVEEIWWRYTPETFHVNLVVKIENQKKSHILAFGGAANLKEATSNPFKYCVELPLNLTATEYKKLKGFIKIITAQGNVRIPSDTCAGSSAAILRKYSEIRIPKLIASFPGLSTGYLYVQQKLGNQKIGEIQAIGGNSASFIEKYAVNPILPLITVSIEIFAISLFFYSLYIISEILKVSSHNLY